MTQDMVEPKPITKVLCPFCSAPWTEGMIELESRASSGCPTCGPESGARVEIKCHNCKRIIYIKETGDWW